MKIFSLKNLGRLRLVFSGVFLLTFTALFSGFIVFKSDAFLITHWQVMPRVLTAVALSGLSTISAMLVIAMVTAFCGRIYCSWICPLGLLQDLIERLSHKISGKKRRYRKANLPLRLAVFIAVAILLFNGFILVMAYLEPYSLFGKIASGVIHAVLVLFNQSTLELEQNGSNFIYNATFFLAISGGILLALAVISAWFGRIFCNTLCPAGTLLSAIAAKSGRRLNIDPELCVNCGKCEQLCNANCINAAEHKIDFLNCFMCLECVSACPKNAIKMYRRRKSDLQNIDMPDQQDRRKILIAAGVAGVSAWGVSKLVNKAGKVPDDAIAPPGAGSVEKFLATCTGCGLCVSNCPGGCLQPASGEYGWKGFMLPTMKFSGKTAGKCEYECAKCSNLCPTGALQKLTRPEKKRCRIGMAYFYPDNCLAYVQGKSCGACQEHCPTAALTMIPGPKGATIPSVNQDLCIGCGNCEYACPVTPKAIRVKGLKKHTQAADKNQYAEQQTAKTPQEGLDFLQNLTDEE
ncbi:MAG: 4Fe-4S dicluster domain-containing protein [Lentisphaerae bacterium]|nr:4Fe-4S dicluster domain-containing protein [Lentisphaerota bacterium]